MEAPKILVVDDDPSILYMVAVALKRQTYKGLGYTVVTAKNGLEARKAIQEEGPFTVMVTDLLMPGISGHELLREARQGDPLLEVVVITAAGSIESAISALRADGAYDYLLKPFESISQLWVVVEKAIKHREMIVEQKMLQARVQSEAEWLRALIAHSGDAILAADAQEKITIANPAAIQMLGKDEIVGKTAAESLPSILYNAIANWQAIGQHRPAMLEIPWPEHATSMLHITPVSSSEGQELGWVLVIRDITHLKRLDDLRANLLAATVRKIQMPLAKTVNDLTELSIALQKDERLGPLVYRLIRDWERVRRWSDDLLDLAQASSSQDLDLQPVDLSILVANHQNAWQQETLQNMSLSLEVQAEPDLPKVMADPLRLQQMLDGLVRRAALRSLPGDRITMKLRQANDQVWIDIQDQGPAIADAEIPRIFEKSFVNLSGDSTSAGLELALIKAIIDQMGGQVWVSAQEPLGSAISIYLPRAD